MAVAGRPGVGRCGRWGGRGRAGQSGGRAAKRGGGWGREALCVLLCVHAGATHLMILERYVVQLPSIVMPS